MQKLGQGTDYRAANRRRAAQVRRERYEQLERQLFKKAITELEAELNSRRLCGPLPSIMATAATLLIPTSIVLSLVLSVPSLPWYVLAAVAVAASSAVAWVGARIWRRSTGSTGLPYSELMLWTWIRHRRAERELVANAQRLGLNRTGEFVAASPLSNEEELAVLYRLNAALELKDAYTLGHSRRVERHSYRIALQLGLPAAEIEALRMAAKLHDIGKLVVPDAVLTKSGRLDDHERELINQHSAAGAKILSVLDRPDIVAAVRHHHERWDGGGYPDGVSGADIPLMARVIAVADTYDAITSSRPYRDRGSRRRAIKVIREERGAQFDPEVADSFLRTLHQHPALPLLAFLVTAPQRLFEKLSSLISNTTSQLASTAAGVTGVALVAAASVSGAVAPAERSPAERSPATITAASSVNPSDEVLGIRIEREPLHERRSGKASLQKRGAKRDPKSGTRSKGGPEVQRSIQEAEPQVRNPARETQASDLEVLPVPGDPHPAKGEDCPKPLAQTPRGQLLHCP